jgi:Na+-transporting NADH:ubiquinone oxidoreductase subunit A
MSVQRIRRGLDLPISGVPEQQVEEHKAPERVALVAADYPGIRPRMHVREGDEVATGQLLLEDKGMPGVRFTSPGSGHVRAVNRGDRRALQTVVVELAAEDRAGRAKAPALASFGGASPERLGRDDLLPLLLESGLWTALRARPFGRVADPRATPQAIFVTAIDTEPLAASVDVALAGREELFGAGLLALTKLTAGPVFVCTSEQSGLSLPDHERLRRERFAGRHPAGNVGLHIHRLFPVDRSRCVWHVGYQDVAAIGVLVTRGELSTERVVALAGPQVKRPRLVRTRLGASLDDLVDGELRDGESRVVSGSVLSGRTAMGAVHGYLGRYHRQVSVLREGRERELLGWAGPGLRRFSVMNTFLSRLFPGRRYELTTSTQGSRRAIVPVGAYERVWPFDILPTLLLRALVMRDIERAEQLGCLELDEEDVALLSFVCPGKVEYGQDLRAVLTGIEREG